MRSLFVASLVTLTLISTFVFSGILLVLILLNDFSIVFALGLTVVFNFVMWLVGPSITDAINRWFYKVKFLTEEEARAAHPEVAALIGEVAAAHKFRFPKFGVIPDQNPTAFTYGSARYNARIIVTEGIFTYLSPDEARAVVAHELGHVVHRDFIVMMVASTLVQLLYETSAILRRLGRKGDKNPLGLLSLIPYALYLISIYFVYYLSRTREYLADAFSAKTTPPHDLANALIKIAYGIVAAPDGSTTARLFQSTRHLGVVDVKRARELGTLAFITHNDPNAISEVMVFDKVNPWATFSELNSTHPLTGKRLEALGESAKASGKPFPYDVEAAMRRMSVRRGALWGAFFRDFLIYLLPAALGAVMIFAVDASLQMFLAGFGIGLLLQLPYRFPAGVAQASTVVDEMRNPYASPVRGRKIALEGQVAGRGVPGFVFGEDMMYQDTTGLIFLDYRSWLGFLGNIFFALKKLKTLLGKPSRATGWFFRSMGSSVVLQNLQTEAGAVQSHPLLWRAVTACLLIAIGVFPYVRGWFAG